MYKSIYRNINISRYQNTDLSISQFIGNKHPKSDDWIGFIIMFPSKLQFSGSEPQTDKHDDGYYITKNYGKNTYRQE